MLARLISRMTSSSVIAEQASPFAQFNFSPAITTLFKEMGFKDPTPIQTESWPAIQSGKDIIGIAQTGSGKTLAYSVPMLMHVMSQTKNSLTTVRMQPPVTMVVLPTRELCRQVSSEYRKFANAVGVKVATVFGGEQKKMQVSMLNYGIHTIIGTPGRMLDMMSDGTLKLKDVNYVVLDEADLMLDMGFEEQIRRILSDVPKKRQTLMFTATWPREIQALAEEFLTTPKKILIGGTDLTMNKDIVHKFYFSGKQEKEKVCTDLVMKNTEGKTLIFTNTKAEANQLKEYMGQKGISCEALHSDREQTTRNYIIREFKSGLLKVMIATDVASRGLDIKDVNLVINYDMPRSFDDYIHRVGRTARAGKKGLAISFLNSSSNPVCLKKLRQSLKEMGHDVPREIDEMIYKNRN